MRELILFIMLHIICYILIGCAETSQPFFIAPPSLMQPCKSVAHGDSNKLINVIDDIIENDNNHAICKEKLEQWQKLYMKYKEQNK
jgi:hypothetical protein